MLEIEFNNFLPASNVIDEVRSFKCPSLKPSNPALLLGGRDLKAARTSFGLVIGRSSNKGGGGHESKSRWMFKMVRIHNFSRKVFIV